MIAKIRSKDAKFDPPTPSQRRDPCNPKRQALAKVWGLSSIGQWIWVPCCFGDCVPKKILNSTKPGWEEPSRSSPKARANNTTHLSLSCTGWWCQPSQLYKHSKIGRYIFQLTLTLFPRVLTVLSADIYIYIYDNIHLLPLSRRRSLRTRKIHRGQKISQPKVICHIAHAQGKGYEILGRSSVRGRSTDRPWLIPPGFSEAGRR